MVKLANRAGMTTATVGTGTITLNAAIAGHQNFADAGVLNGELVRYVIEDGTDWEIGEGVYTSAGTTLTRVVLESSSVGSPANDPISLTGNAIVFIDAAAEDLALYGDPTSAFLAHKNGTAQNFTDANEADLAWSGEVYDVGSEFATPTYTILNAGKYFLNCAALVTATGTGTTEIRLVLFKNGAFDQLLQSITALSGLSKITIGRPIIVDGQAGDAFKVRAQFVGLTAGTATISGVVGESWFNGVRISDARSVNATTAVAGVSELATDAETLTGADAARTITPSNLTAKLAALTSINGGQLAGFRNLLINPDGRFNQKLAAANADNTYGHDRWLALTQTSTIAVSTVSDAENGTPRMWRLTQSQASAQRMGYAQWIEGANCKHLRGKSVTLSGRINFSLNAAVRYAICEWTGTEDTPAAARNIVNNWTNGTFTAGQFFKSTTFNVLAVGTITPAAATLTDLTALTATVGNSANNLVVFFWTEGTAAQNATLDGALQLEQGAVATAREFRPFGIEVALCLRYFEKGFPLDTAPANNVAAYRTGGGAYSTTFVFSTRIHFKQEKRVSPTITSYSSNVKASPTAGQWQVFIGGAWTDTSGFGASVDVHGFTGDVTGTFVNLGFYFLSGLWTADAEI